jgi:hypothetical protein
VLRTERPRRSCLSSAAAASGLPDPIDPRPNPRRWDEALSSLVTTRLD